MEKKIEKKIQKNKKYKIVKLAYNFSKNICYNHPNLKSSVYFYHPLRVCILSTKIKGNSPDLMALCLLHNIFENTQINKNVVRKILEKKL